MLNDTCDYAYYAERGCDSKFKSVTYRYVFHIPGRLAGAYLEGGPNRRPPL